MSMQVTIAAAFLLVRCVAAIEAVLNLLGMFWFFGHYFSAKNVVDMAVFITPIIALGVGAFLPDRALSNKVLLRTFWMILLAGIGAMGVLTYGDVFQLNAPDYAALQARLIDMGLLFLLLARVVAVGRV